MVTSSLVAEFAVFVPFVGLSVKEALPYLDDEDIVTALKKNGDSVDRTVTYFLTRTPDAYGSSNQFNDSTVPSLL